MKKLFFILFAFFLISSCKEKQVQPQIEAAAKKPLTVYASIFPLYDFTRQIGGSFINTELVIAGGTDPHSFELSPRKAGKIIQADLFIYLNKTLEPWAEKMHRNRGKSLSVAAGSEDLHIPCNEHEKNHPDEKDDHGYGKKPCPHHAKHHKQEHDAQESHHNHGAFDPHTWLDPVAAREMAHLIYKSLVTLLPEKEKALTENYNKLAQELTDLDSLYRKELKNISHRTLVVSHAAFGHLAKRYNLEQKAITGISPQQEPSAATMAEIIRKIKADKIPALFVDHRSRDRIAATIEKETGAKTAELDTLAAPAGKTVEKATYVELMKKNLKTLVENLK